MFRTLCLIGLALGLSNNVSASVMISHGVGIASIDTTKLKDGSVTNPKIADGAVDTAKIATDAVTTVKIINSAVDTTKLGDAAVTTIKVANSAIDTGKLATDSVTTVKIIAGAVDTTKLSAYALIDTTKQAAFSQLGIGTASPLSTLDVNGQTTIRGAETVVGSGTFTGEMQVRDAIYAKHNDDTAGGMTYMIWGGPLYNRALFRAQNLNTKEGILDEYIYKNDGTQPLVQTLKSDSITNWMPTTIVSSMTVTGAFTPGIKTKAQIDAIVPALGDIYTCSDCTLPYAICVATGTAKSGFRRMDSASAGCGTDN